MAETLELEIVTPERLVAREHVAQVQIPGKAGELGVLPGHAPLITELATGEISYLQGGMTHYLAVSWGFVEVLPEKVTILAVTAERPEEIDVPRAQAAKARADEALRQAAPDLDYEATQQSLRRAEVRLEVAARTGHVAATH